MVNSALFWISHEKGALVEGKPSGMGWPAGYINGEHCWSSWALKLSGFWGGFLVFSVCSLEPALEFKPWNTFWMLHWKIWKDLMFSSVFFLFVFFLLLLSRFWEQSGVILVSQSSWGWKGPLGSKYTRAHLCFEDMIQDSKWIAKQSLGMCLYWSTHHQASLGNSSYSWRLLRKWGCSSSWLLHIWAGEALRERERNIWDQGRVIFFLILVADFFNFHVPVLWFPPFWKPSGSAIAVQHWKAVCSPVTRRAELTGERMPSQSQAPSLLSAPAPEFYAQGLLRCNAWSNYGLTASSRRKTDHKDKHFLEWLSVAER